MFINRKYGEEFKGQAIKLAEEIGVKAASEKLGITDKTIYNWRQRKRIQEGLTAPKKVKEKSVHEGKTKEDLIKELEELREANYILAKALGFFAKG